MAAKAAAAVTMENFITSWNAEFPDYQLKVEDLKSAHAVMGSLFQIFDRLGIDRDAVLMPPTERNLNAHVMYYWDLLPAINMTRVINHVSAIPQSAMISINHFLQPTAQTSRSILMLMFNLMVFNEQRLQSIAPCEKELFNYSDMIKELEDKINELREQLNEQAVEKGDRAQRMEQMQQDIQRLEEELQYEELARDKEKQRLEEIIKQNNTTDMLLDQKRATKEGLLAERERKKAMRVYDAADIQTQAAQEEQNKREVEEKVNAITDLIAQKEHSLQVLQTIKPGLDTANNLLHDITKMEDFEVGDLEDEDGELEILRTELMELEAQEAEIMARRADADKKRSEGQSRRQQERTVAESAVREAEEKDKKRREFIVKATQKTHQIKNVTMQYKEEKTQRLEEINQLKEEHIAATKAWTDELDKLVATFTKDMLNKKKAIERK